MIIEETKQVRIILENTEVVDIFNAIHSLLDGEQTEKDSETLKNFVDTLEEVI